MKSIFILYMPGYAGNFLTRLFSLSPETLPQVPIDVLKKTVIETGQVPEITNRAEYYSFNHTKKFTSWQEFHRAWPDFYQQELFEYFNALYLTPFSHVIFSIHPHEFLLLQDNILKTNCEFYCVDPDPQLRLWVESEQKKLHFSYRPTYEQELYKFQQLRDKYSMQSISLTNIVMNPNSFIDEYTKIANQMQISPVVDAATVLYKDWYAVRGPKLC